MPASNPGLIEVSKTRKESPVAAAMIGEQPPRLMIDAQKALHQTNQSAPSALESMSHDLHALRDMMFVVFCEDAAGWLGQGRCFMAMANGRSSLNVCFPSFSGIGDPGPGCSTLRSHSWATNPLV